MCSKCRAIKTAAEFAAEPRNRNGLRSNCHACVSATRPGRIARRGYLTPTEKKCCACHEIKPIAAFHKNRTSDDGHYGKCKLCVKAGPEGPCLCVICRQLQHRNEFRSCKRRGQRTECRTCENTQLRCRACNQLKHPAKFAPDKQLTTGRKSHCRDCENVANKTPSGRARQARSKYKRRANLASTVCAFSGAEWQSLLVEYGHRCAYCRLPFDENRKATQDHLIPVSKGGSHTKQNIVPACLPCNLSKYVEIRERPEPWSPGGAHESASV